MVYLPFIYLLLGSALCAQDPTGHPGIQTPINDQGWDTTTTGGGSCQGCSGPAVGYPDGFTFKAVFLYQTGSTCRCATYLISTDSSEFLGNADCTLACIPGVNRK